MVSKLILLALCSITLMALSTYIATQRRALGAFVVITGALGIALLFSHH